jgi:hypothetical protein
MVDGASILQPALPMLLAKLADGQPSDKSTGFQKRNLAEVLSTQIRTKRLRDSPLS